MLASFNIYQMNTSEIRLFQKTFAIGSDQVPLSLRSPSLFYLLVHSRCSGFLFSLDHTQTHATVSRTPLDEGSARRRDFYTTTQTLYKINIHVPSGIGSHDPSKRSAADLPLRPRGHWDHPIPVRMQKEIITLQNNDSLTNVSADRNMENLMGTYLKISTPPKLSRRKF
jgi:hypothetical protein